jgi:hypothetical protein
MLAWLIIGCSGDGGELTALPSSLHWGEIDFHSEMPEEGYGSLSLALSNTGEESLELEIDVFDFGLLCMQGFEEAPIPLGKLGPGMTYSLVVGVCNYNPESGMDNMLEGEIGISHTGGEGTLGIPWSFTPVRLIGGDTG